MKMGTAILLGLFSAGPWGCASVPSDEFGPPPTPITLSGQAQFDYLDFKEHPHPYYFVVSQDGRTSWGYNFCEEIRCQKAGARAQLIERCEKNANGQRCYLYANKDGPLWK